MAEEMVQTYEFKAEIQQLLEESDKQSVAT